MPKIGLIVTPGHNFDDPGATNEAGQSEFPETRLWADEIARYAHAHGIEVSIVAAGRLSAKIASTNNLAASMKAKGLQPILLSVHFNSFAFNPEIHSTRTPDGFETLYCPGSVKGKALATLIQGAMAKVMPGKNRGVKEGWYRADKKNGALAELEKTTCPAVIIEPEFVQHFDVITSKRSACCSAIALALSELNKAGGM